MTIHLHIERLVLEDLPVGPHAAEAVRAAVEAELRSALAEPGERPWPGASSNTPRARVDMTLSTNQPAPSELGALIGRSVYEGLGR